MHDDEVVTSIVAGHPRGLALAYDRYADPLYTYCRTLLCDPSETDVDYRGTELGPDPVTDAITLPGSRNALGVPAGGRRRTRSRSCWCRTPAGATVALTVTVDQFVPCGTAAASAPPTITVEPGGAVYSVCTSLPKRDSGGRCPAWAG